MHFLLRRAIEIHLMLPNVFLITVIIIAIATSLGCALIVLLLIAFLCYKLRVHRRKKDSEYEKIIPTQKKESITTPSSDKCAVKPTLG